jgi:hypothetical protein
MDIHAKSQELLESLANSILDRSPHQPVFFHVNEMHIVERFLEEYAKEVQRKLGEY